MGTPFDSATVPELQARLKDWVASRDSADRSIRRQALEEAHRLVVRAVDEWLRAIEPEANALYRRATARLVGRANQSISRVASDAGDVDADDLPSEIDFRAKRHFYFYQPDARHRCESGDVVD